VRRRRDYWSDKLWMAIAKDDQGKVIGLMWYKLESFQGRMSVKRFFYLNSQGSECSANR
jgi:hypothetical protein